MEIIDHYEFQGQGYNPFLITDRWQVAFLNYADAEALEQIEKLDIHHHTDEVFVLLQGQVALIAAVISEEGEIEYDVADMKPGVVYNIRKETWHKVAMTPGSQLLIIENNNTHLDDFEFFDLSGQQKEQLRLCVQKALSFPEK